MVPAVGLPGPLITPNEAEAVAPEKVGLAVLLAGGVNTRPDVTARMLACTATLVAAQPDDLPTVIVKLLCPSFRAISPGLQATPDRYTNGATFVV